jgi:diguanylate cyclase (GGDEF)-like protein
MTVEDLLPASLHERHRAHRAAFAQQPTARTMGDGSDLEVLRGDGSSLAVDIALSPLPGGNVCVVLSDATDRRRRARRLRRLADEDPLTGLLNRRGLRTAVDELVLGHRRATDRFALLAIDVDRFKAINDSAGHPVGDQLLRAIADVMRRHTRADDVLGRTGGDEFLICLLGTDARGAAGVAQTLREHVVGIELCDGAGRPIRATISIGIAGFPDDDVDPAALLAVADGRLYAAKAGGRDGVRWGSGPG